MKSTSSHKIRKHWIGPGVVMAASGIGASDIIAATVSGAAHGHSLLWALVLGAFLKFVLSEGVARWQLATGSTTLEGWARHLPPSILMTFAVYLVIWTVAVSGALISSCGLAIETVTNGAVPRTWGALFHALAAFALIGSSHSDGFTRVMKPLIVIMFAGIIFCAAVTFREPASVIRGVFLPTVPADAGAHVLSLIGGIGGSLTLLSYNYLLHDDAPADARGLRAVRIDLIIAYLFTAIFAVSVSLVASSVFFAKGEALTDRQAVSGMANALAGVIGRPGFYVYSIGFWAAVVASLVGVWRTIPSVFGDCYALIRKMPPEERARSRRANSPPYRLALTFMAITSLPFAVLGRPLLVVIAFTVIGSLFIPFLATTLLVLNNRVEWRGPIPRNSRCTNLLLVLAVLLFLIVAATETIHLVR